MWKVKSDFIKKKKKEMEESNIVSQLPAFGHINPTQ